MTKFDVYMENLLQKREAKRDAEINEKLALRLHTRSYEETVAELLQNLTVIIGVRDVIGNTAERKTAKSLVF